jgi:hypothetical protein
MKHLKKFFENQQEDVDNGENTAPNEPLELAKKCLEACKECKEMCEEEGKDECVITCQACVLACELYIFSIENDTKNHKEAGELTLDIVKNNIEMCEEHGAEHCVEDCNNFAEELERHLKEDY